MSEASETKVVDLMIAAPTHGELITSGCTSTLMALVYEGARRGWTCGWRLYSGAVIYEMRNLMVAHFMATKATHLLMVDSDQVFAPSLVADMLALDKPVVGAIYPKRRLQWARIEENLPAKPFARARALGLDYVGELIAELDADGAVSYAMEGNFAKAKRLGTGVLLIRRDAVERMMERFPELSGMGFPNDEGQAPAEFRYGFFNPMFSEEKMDHLSEDYSFCDRWRIGCGGEIWAHVTARIGHVGPYVFEGAFMDYLEALYDAEIRE